MAFQPQQQTDASGQPYWTDPTGQMHPGQAPSQAQYFASQLQGGPLGTAASMAASQPQGGIGQAVQPVQGIQSMSTSAPAQNWAQYSGNPTDPQQIAAYVQYLSQQPGADPTLASDPNYWIGKISDTGGLTQGNIGYWGTRSLAGAGNPGGAGSSSAPGGFSFDPNSVASSPGYQFALQQTLDSADSNLAAQGKVLGPGAMKDIANYASGVAQQWEPLLYGQANNTFQTNFGDLSSLANTGFNATNQAANYNTGAAAAGAAGTVGSANAINGGINSASNAIQNGYFYNQFNPNAQAPKSAYSPVPNPGSQGYTSATGGS